MFTNLIRHPTLTDGRWTKEVLNSETETRKTPKTRWSNSMMWSKIHEHAMLRTNNGGKICVGVGRFKK